MDGHGATWALLQASRTFLSLVRDLAVAEREVGAALEHRASVVRAIDRAEVAVSDAVGNYAQQNRHRAIAS